MDDENYGGGSSKFRGGEKGGHDQPLLTDKKHADDSSISVPETGFGFNYGNRPYKDVGFSISFAIFLVANLGLGIFAYVNRNPKYTWEETSSSDCTLPAGPSLMSWKASSSGVFRISGDFSLDSQLGIDPTLKVGLYAVGATLILGVPIVAFFLWILRVYTKELVYITIPLSLISELGAFVAYFVLCSSSEQCREDMSASWRYGILGFGIFLDLIFIWIIYKNWDRIQLSISIMKTVAEALNKNLGLLVVLPVLDLVFYVYFIPSFVFIYYARTNGSFVTNPEIISNPKLSCGGSSTRDCCVWESDSWVPWYSFLGLFTIIWASLVASNVYTYVSSGTVAQWYFSLAGSSTAGNMKRSIGHAVGPSFGTLCLSGLIVTIVRLIRSAIESAETNRGQVGCLALIVRACLECIVQAVEFVTKFTTNFAAITGENFCSSAKMTFDMLKRNLLSTVVVEAVSGRLMYTAVFGLTVVYGLVMWGILATVAHSVESVGWVALAAAVVLMLMLGFIVRVLEHIVDTVYICYAMDKDHNEVSKPEVHDVYVLLPFGPSDRASLAVSRPS